MFFVHGSANPLSVGDQLLPRGDEYQYEYAERDYYRILERYRPADKLAHHESVFMCAELEDIDRCGGFTDTITLVSPLNPNSVSRHDQAWVSNVLCLIDLDDVDELHPSVVHACQQYWDGQPASDEPTWEYVCDGARVLDVILENDENWQLKEDHFEKMISATRHEYEHRSDPLDYTDANSPNRDLGL